MCHVSQSRGQFLSSGRDGGDPDLFCSFSVAAAAHEGSLQDGADNREALPCLQLRGEGQQTRMLHLKIRVQLAQHQHLRPEETRGWCRCSSEDSPRCHQGDASTGSPPVFSVQRNLLQPDEGVASCVQRQTPDPISPLLYCPAGDESNLSLLHMVHPRLHPSVRTSASICVQEP